MHSRRTPLQRRSAGLAADRPEPVRFLFGARPEGEAGGVAAVAWFFVETVSSPATSARPDVHEHQRQPSAASAESQPLPCRDGSRERALFGCSMGRRAEC